MSDEPDKTIPSSVPPPTPEEDDVLALLKKIGAAADAAVEYGKQANERLGAIEQRLLRLERHVGLNGRGFDTEPAPITEPENLKPEGG